jgi:hypothetical protein
MYPVGCGLCLTLRSGFSYNLDIRTAEFSGREAFWAVFQAKRRYPAVQKRETQVEPPSSLGKPEEFPEQFKELHH